MLETSRYQDRIIRKILRNQGLRLDDIDPNDVKQMREEIGYPPEPDTRRAGSARKHGERPRRGDLINLITTEMNEPDSAVSPVRKKKR